MMDLVFCCLILSEDGLILSSVKLGFFLVYLAKLVSPWLPDIGSKDDILQRPLCVSPTLTKSFASIGDDTQRAPDGSPFLGCARGASFPISKPYTR